MRVVRACYAIEIRGGQRAQIEVEQDREYSDEKPTNIEAKASL